MGNIIRRGMAFISLPWGLEYRVLFVNSRAVLIVRFVIVIIVIVTTVVLISILNFMAIMIVIMIDIQVMITILVVIVWFDSNSFRVLYLMLLSIVTMLLLFG